MKKTGLALLLSATMLVATAGCSGSSSASAVPPTTEPAQSGSSETAESTAWKPDQTITIDVAFGAGGDTDYNARMYAEKLGDILGTSVIVANVTGGGGAVASEEVKNASPDGYTVLFTQTSFFLNQAAGITDYGIDAFELGCVAGRSSGWLLVAPAASGITTLEDIVKKSQTESIVYGGSAGATGSMIGEQFNLAGAKFNVVDYGSATDKVAGMLSGDISVSAIPILTAMPYVESGEFVALGLCEQERNECFPDIPTALEQGYNVVCPTYYFFAFPDGTPSNVVDTFADACQQIYESDTYKDKLYNTYSQVPVFAKGEEAKGILNDFAATVETLKDVL